MEPPTNIIVDGTTEDEMLLYLNLKMKTQLEYSINLYSLVSCLKLKSMQAHWKLAQGNTKRVCPMMGCVWGLDNRSIPHLHEVLNIEIHLHI